MYKKQMKLQKVFCLISILSGAFMFVYALGIMTDLYDTLYSTMRNPYDLTQTSVPGSFVYYEMQGFNRTFLYLSIALILAACLLFITNTHVRRRYYIGNYIAVCLYSALSLITVIWAHFQILYYKSQFLKVDFAALKEHSELRSTYYTESTFWLDIHYLIFVIVLVAVALQIYNLVWKTNLMKEEARLLEGGAGKEMA
ncbi:MAG: hypothetical protein K5696_09330 [Lachnospiraceae bacterium]|nr:hypothetical protein [Lachnospiraceae bacterium]